MFTFKFVSFTIQWHFSFARTGLILKTHFTLKVLVNQGRAVQARQTRHCLARFYHNKYVISNY
jgi:hypothetical protein